MDLLRLKVVLAAIEYDDASLAVLEAARALARAGGAALHVVHVDAPRAITEVPPDEVEGTSLDAGVAMLGRANLRLEDAQLHVVAGEPAHVIRTLADRIRADVIVLGPHREHDSEQRQLGGTALAVATASWAPCLIVRRGMHLPLERVLVPVDMSDTARGALMVALSWSSALRPSAHGPQHGAPTHLTALHVERSGAATGSSSGAQALATELDRVRGEAGTWAGVEVKGATVASSDVVAAITDRAAHDRVDLIVLGTRGLGLDAVGRLGAVSAAVIRRAEVPVLLVPPAVWTEYNSR